MTQRIPFKWSYIIKYIGGHQNIKEECNVILRFTKEKVEIEKLFKRKIKFDYQDCTLETQSFFNNQRVILTYKTSPETKGRIFFQLKKEKYENIVDIFNIYKKIALGLEDEIPQESYKYFKLIV